MIYKGSMFIYKNSLDENSKFKFPENLQNALVLIQQAVAGEKKDSLFYTFLLNNAPSYEDIKIINGIREDEINHNKMFSSLYYDITAKEVPPIDGEEFIEPSSYCEGLKFAIFGEQESVQSYRQILYAMQMPVHVNMLTEIITDEIRHGSLYNYLYSKNQCNI